MKYITVGFEKDADADRFQNLIKGNGHKITVATKQDVVSPWVLHNIQAKTTHVWTPSSAAEARRFEVAGVVIEFADDDTAAEFLRLAASFLTRPEYHPEEKQGPHYHEDAYDLAGCLTGNHVKGIRMER